MDNRRLSVTLKKEPTKRTPKQARSRATIEVILTAAAQVLERHGYRQATTDRIAERAGVSVGSIYQYFANKDEVFERLFERESKKNTDALELIAGTNVPDSHERMRAYLTAGATQELLTPKLYDELAHIPKLRTKIDKFSEALVNHTAKLIQSARPELDSQRARTLAELVVATSEGIGRPLRSRRNDELLDTFIEMIDQYVLGSGITPG